MEILCKYSHIGISRSQPLERLFDDSSIPAFALAMNLSISGAAFYSLRTVRDERKQRLGNLCIQSAFGDGFMMEYCYIERRPKANKRALGYRVATAFVHSKMSDGGAGSYRYIVARCFPRN